MATNKEVIIELKIETEKSIKELKVLEQELKRLKKNTAEGSPVITAAQSVIDSLKLEIEAKKAATKDAIALEKLETEAIKKSKKEQADATEAAAKKQTDAAKKVQKANENLGQAIADVTKFVFTAVSTFEQFGIATEDQGKLIGKLFQAIGILQTAETAFNAVKSVSIVLTEAQTLSTLQLTAGTEALAVAEAEATVTTRALGFALAVLGGPVTLLLTGVAALGTAFLVFRKTTFDLIEEDKKLTDVLKKQNETYIEQAKSIIEVTRAQIAQTDIRAAENFEFRQSNILSEQGIRIGKEELKKIQANTDGILKQADAQNALGNAIGSTTSLSSGQSAIIANNVAKRIELEKFIAKSEKEQADRKEKRNKDLRDQQLKDNNELLQSSINSLETRTDLESKFNSQQLSFQQKRNEITNKTFADEKSKQLEINSLNQEINNSQIEFDRDKRDRDLNTFNIKKDQLIAELEQTDNVGNKFKIIEEERIKSQEELNVAIANFTIPLQDQVLAQQNINLAASRKQLNLVKEINLEIESINENIKEIQLGDKIAELSIPTESLVQDFNNTLEIIELSTNNKIEDINKRFEILLKSAVGNEALTAALKKQRDAELEALDKSTKAKIVVETKANALLIQAAILKDLTIDELANKALEREKARSQTSFDRIKEINNLLLESTIKRIKQQEVIDILNAKGNSAEIDRIKNASNFAITEAERLNKELNDKIDRNILTKIFGSPEDIKDFINGVKKTTDTLDNLFSSLDQFNNTSVNNFKAIGNSVKELTGLAGTLVDTINNFDKDTTTEEKVAAITAAVGEALSAITGQISEALTQQITNQIDGLEKDLDRIKEKKDELDTEIKDSLSNIKQLESELAEQRGDERAKTIRLIEAEKAREKSLTAEKLKQFEIEKQINEKKKALLKKAFETKKAISIVEAIINTAVGVTSALTIPPPAGIILAAITGALGVAQVAVIASQPTPEFKHGGFGPSGTNDSQPVNAQLHANEYVISAPQVRNPKYRNFINELEKDAGRHGYQSGGIVVPNESPDSILNKTLDVAIQLSQRPIVVSVVQIDDAQARRAQVSDFTSL